MKTRMFRFKDPCNAVDYIGFLIDQEVTFTVYRNADRIDVTIPADTPPSNWPNPRTLVAA
jgi:hypothetical protein